MQKLIMNGKVYFINKLRYKKKINRWINYREEQVKKKEIAHVFA